MHNVDIIVLSRFSLIASSRHQHSHVSFHDKIKGLYDWKLTSCPKITRESKEIPHMIDELLVDT